MENPFQKPRTSENFFKDVEDFARDLAYGVVSDGWQQTFQMSDSFPGRPWRRGDKLTPMQQEFGKKWYSGKKHHPAYETLVAFGFLDILASRRIESGISTANVTQYNITRKAFDLLRKPAQSPSIFISYRRKESSTFALLVESRLRIAGADPKRIFIDKTIPIGDEWEAHLTERLISCEVFICLVGKTAFDDGSWLKREIDILNERNPDALILPVFHNGIQMESSSEAARVFGKIQSATVKDESALEYENAINHILNRLGYETYWPSPTSPFSGL